MLLSICIPNFNRANCLDNCLNSIVISKKNSNLKFEVCISDNNSSDNIENDQEINDLNISDEIIKLNKLKDEGILTEQEYEKAKKKLLD